MSQHQPVFTIEKALPAAEAAPGIELPSEGLVPAPQVPAVVADAPKPGRKRALRALLFAGVAVAALAGAADFGWHYWTVGRFEVSTDDAYVRGRQHDDCSEGLRLYRRMCWWATTSR